MQPRCHATLTQPLQCVLQHHVANLHVSIRTWQHQRTTIMQPFQCDLQPRIQEAQRTTPTGTTTRCKTHRGNQSRPERPQPHPPHTGGIFHRRHAAILHRKIQGFVLRLPPHNMAHATFMQPFQCDLQPQLRETQRTTPTGTATRCKTHRGNQSRPEQPQPHPLHTGGTFHRRMQPLYTEKYKVSCSGFLPKTWPMQHSCSHSNAICNHSFKKRKELRPQEQPLVAKHIEGTNRVRNNRSHTRRTHEVPFIAACSHFTRKKTRFRAPASSPTQSPCTIPMRSATSPLPSFITTSLRHHFPSSPLPIVTASLRHHFPSSPLPFVTTSLRHHFPSSPLHPLPFITTSLHHHFPSSPLPFVTTSHRHRFPSSPLPFVTTSLCHTSLRHHFPSSPLPFVTTSLRHHFPLSPLPFVTTSLHSLLFFCDVL